MEYGRLPYRRSRAWLMVGMILVLGLAPACEEAPLKARPEMETAAAEGICLTQLRSDRIEIVQLDGGWREHRIPWSSDAPPISWGRMASDGSYGVASDGRHLVGVTPDGRQLWILKDISPSGMPAISADAKKVAFTSRNQQLTVYEVSTRDLRRLEIHGRNPAWALRPDRLAYDDGERVNVCDLVTGTSFEVGRGTEPSWSPDGTSLAVRVNSKQVDLVNVQTRERRVFIDASSEISIPRWSPNGEWMMYTRRGPRHWWSKADWTGSEPSQILIRHVKDGTETSIGEFYKANPGDYTWVTNRELCRQTPPRQ